MARGDSGKVAGMPSTRRVAVYDLGSSSFHLMVVDASLDGMIEPIMKRRSFLDLGTEVARTGGVPSDRANAAVRSAHRLSLAAHEAGADLVVAMATAALRDATNGRALLKRLERTIGGPIRLLTGEEEARLCFVGQRAGVWVGPDPVLGLDLGGGSLEAAIGNATSIDSLASVALGTARLRGELGDSGNMTKADASWVRELVGERSAPILAMKDAHAAPVTRLLASGGTVRALARLALGLHRPRSQGSGSVPVNQVELAAGQIHDLAGRLVSLDLDARLALPGIQARRAPLLPVGAVVLSTLVELLGMSALVVSEWGLREGAVLNALAVEGGRTP